MMNCETTAREKMNDAPAQEMKRLLQRMNWTETSIDTSEYFTFSIGHFYYGMKKENIHDLVDVPESSEMKPGKTEGACSINHQGKRIPVFDMTPDHEKVSGVNGTHNAIIIVKFGEEYLGMIVSRGTDVIGVY